MPRATRPAPMPTGPAPAPLAVQSIAPGLASAAVADPRAWLALDHQLCFALYSASLTMTKVYQPLLKPLGLTYPQYLVMLVLWAQQEAGVQQLGERLMLDSGTLTPLLKRLAERGLVSRQRDPADERRVRVRLTAEGQALQQQALSVPPAVLAACGCQVAELAQQLQQLKTLRAQLQRVLSAGSTGPEAESDPGAEARTVSEPGSATRANTCANARAAPLCDATSGAAASPATPTRRRRGPR